MQITPHLIEEIKSRLRQPVRYQIVINAILPHGTGVVVCYTVQEDETKKLEYRVIAFQRNSLKELVNKFDMIV